LPELEEPLNEQLDFAVPEANLSPLNFEFGCTDILDVLDDMNGAPMDGCDAPQPTSAAVAQSKA
jgi:hypothetical protein